MAFRPGDHIYTKTLNTERVYRLLSLTRCECTIPHCRNLRWTLSLEHIDYEGSDCGYVKTTDYIDPYEGHTPLKQLKAFPLEYHPEKRKIKAALIERGRSFVGMRGVHYSSYEGVAEALSGSRNTTFLGEDDEFPFQSLQVCLRPSALRVILILKRSTAVS
jgi:hypothetical protein